MCVYVSIYVWSFCAEGSQPLGGLWHHSIFLALLDSQNIQRVEGRQTPSLSHKHRRKCSFTFAYIHIRLCPFLVPPPPLPSNLACGLHGCLSFFVPVQPGHSFVPRVCVRACVSLCRTSHFLPPFPFPSHTHIAFTQTHTYTHTHTTHHQYR